MRTAKHERPRYFICSLLAISSSWLLSCAYHVYSSWRFWHGIPIGHRLHLTVHDLIPWMFWTGIFCMIGWITVGIPLILSGDRVLQKPVRSTIIVGISGAAIMLVPTLLWTIPEGQFTSLLNPESWGFCGIAFVIATVSALFYQLYLRLTNRLVSARTQNT